MFKFIIITFICITYFILILLAALSEKKALLLRMDNPGKTGQIFVQTSSFSPVNIFDIVCLAVVSHN